MLAGDAAAEVKPPLAGGGEAAAQPSTKAPAPASEDAKPTRSVITVRDRRTVQRQREQQQIAKALAGDEPKLSAIVTARKPAKTIPDGWLPDTPEERNRRGDAADALFQEMKRTIAAAVREDGARQPKKP